MVRGSLSPEDAKGPKVHCAVGACVDAAFLESHKYAVRNYDGNLGNGRGNVGQITMSIGQLRVSVTTGPCGIWAKRSKNKPLSPKMTPECRKNRIMPREYT